MKWQKNISNIQAQMNEFTETFDSQLNIQCKLQIKMKNKMKQTNKKCHQKTSCVCVYRLNSNKKTAFNFQNIYISIRSKSLGIRWKLTVNPNICFSKSLKLTVKTTGLFLFFHILYPRLLFFFLLFFLPSNLYNIPFLLSIVFCWIEFEIQHKFNEKYNTNTCN